MDEALVICFVRGTPQTLYVHVPSVMRKDFISDFVIPFGLGDPNSDMVKVNYDMPIIHQVR